MVDGICREGGPHKIEQVGHGQYKLEIPIPIDSAGMTARECTNASCSPGAFKIKNGTGLTEPQAMAFCPYCRMEDDPHAFVTRDQVRYAKDIVTNKAISEAQGMFAKALGLGSSGKKRIGGGMFSIEMSMNTRRQPPVRRPWEENLRRDLTCPQCTLQHAVYGLAVWCPDCGKDIFCTHVEAEAAVVRSMLRDVERRSRELGPRVAARDIENGLEDVVSIFETANKVMARRKLLANGHSLEEVDIVLANKIRNRFQSVEGAVDALAEHFGLDLTSMIDAANAKQFKDTLEKRHPITHNLGIVDKKYLEKVRSTEREGRDVSLDEQEVMAALDTAIALVSNVHAGLFPG